MYNTETDKVSWTNITDSTAMVSALGNKGDFKDFYSDINEDDKGNTAVASYDNVPIDNDLHKYVGYYLSSIEESNNMIITDGNRNPVALYTLEDSYRDYHNIPIVDWDELSKCASCADGLNFQVGYDKDGNVICVG